MATNKQKRAAELLIENRGKPMGEILERAGYSEATQSNPKQVTESIGWNELMEEMYPDRKVESVLNEALDANRTISTISGSKANGGTVDFVDVPDWSTRIDAVKEIHKVKGKYPTEKHELEIKGYRALTEEEIDGHIANRFATLAEAREGRVAGAIDAQGS